MDALASGMSQASLFAAPGWVFYSADFSSKANGKSRTGRVMLTRDEEGQKDWFALDEEKREVIALYCCGTGESLEEALQDAFKRASDL